MAQIPENVREILLASTRTACTVTLPARLSRVHYLSTNKVLENLGGRWDKRAKRHVFDQLTAEQLAEAMDCAITTGEYIDHRKELNWFPTPEALANTMLDIVMPSAPRWMLEPSAGQGAIAQQALHRGVNVCAVEIDERRCEELALMWCVAPKQLTVHHADFLAWAEDEAAGIEFDAVVMNPPFSKGRDCLHVLAAWDLLKDGGRLVAIVSPGFEYRETSPYTALRGLITWVGGIVTPIPAGTFKDAGTNVETRMIVLQKGKEACK